MDKDNVIICYIHMEWNIFHRKLAIKMEYEPQNEIFVIKNEGKAIIVKVVIFPVVMYECESWTIKKAEHRTIDAFKLWCWKRHLRVPWTARRSNQSILKEINLEYLLERLMLKLRFKSFGHLIQRSNSREKILMLGKIVGRRRRE